MEILSFYILLQAIVDATTYSLILGDREEDSCFTRGFEKTKECLSCTKSDDGENETETGYVQIYQYVSNNYCFLKVKNCVNKYQFVTL